MSPTQPIARPEETLKLLDQLSDISALQTRPDLCAVIDALLTKQLDVSSANSGRNTLAQLLTAQELPRRLAAAVTMLLKGLSPELVLSDACLDWLSTLGVHLSMCMRISDQLWPAANSSSDRSPRVKITTQVASAGDWHTDRFGTTACF